VLSGWRLCDGWRHLTLVPSFESLLIRLFQPSSVFISKGFLPIVKVNDHGLSHVVPTSMLFEDPDFVAPELLTGAGSFNPQVDIWSLGELLYYMLFKTPPFNK
jgi:serine/threonine protein kinase